MKDKLNKLIKNPAFLQFTKYVLVGSFVTLIDMIALHCFYHIIGINVKLSVVLGFICGNISSFILNKYYTFRNYSTTIIRQYLKYFVTSMSGLAWTVFLMSLFYEELGLFVGISKYNYLLCKMLVAVMVMFWNFIIIRNWTLANYELKSIFNFSDKKSQSLYLSVIIPAYNEELRIPRTLERVIEYLNQQEFSWEIIVVDDGSTDGMLDMIKHKYADIKNLLVHSYQKNLGKGAAVRTGMLIANGEYRLFMDADNQIEIDELETFLPLTGENNILIGSKYKHHSTRDNKQGKISIVRRIVSRIGNLLIRFILNLPYKDTQCGFKLIPGIVADTLFKLQRLNGFSFDIEMLVIAELLGINVIELPVTIHDVNESRVRTVRDSIRVFADLVKIKLFVWKNVYKIDLLKSVNNPGNHQ